MVIQPDVIRVLEVDPDLGQDLEPSALAVARPRAIARARWLEPGRWQPFAEEWDHRGHLGLLIVDGFLARSLQLGARRCAELLGPGDVLRPWVRLAEYSSVPIEDGWEVLEPTRLGVLDRRFAVALAAWPEITAAILDRMMARSRWLAFHLAVAHLRRVESRVHVALWHFADRWGHVSRNGVELRLNITHSLLAEIVAAERPSVTLALSTLRDRGLVEREGDHVWRLHGRPPGELDEVRVQAAGPLR
jgi:CRP/FNR family transcriptional regulator, cyclic AMP receptor protein